MKEIDDLLRKAARSLSAAEMLFKNGDTDFAASRAYYGYFYIAEALLLRRDLTFSRHGQVIAQYGLHFAKTGELPPNYHQAMIQIFSLRQAGDYEAAPNLDKGEVRELIEEGRNFLDAARDYLDREDTEVRGHRPENG